MKPFLQKLFARILFFMCITGCSNSNEIKQITKEDYLKASVFMDKDLNKLAYNKITNQKWSENGFLVYSKNTKEGKVFILVNSKTKEKNIAFNHSKLAESLGKQLDKEFDSNNLLLKNVIFSENENTFTFSIYEDAKPSNSSNIYDKYVLNLNDYSVQKIDVKASEKEHISPNGKLAAYIDNYNLWVRNLETNKKTQLTFDGVEDYGYGTNNAGWIKSDNAVLKWSPNSDKIATFQQDARGVGEMYLTSTNVGHPKLEAWKHPLPGDLNVFRLERVIIHLGTNPKLIRLKMPADFQRGTRTDHVANRSGELLDAQWKKDGLQFAFVSSSRNHKVAHLQIANTYTGVVSSIHKEEVDTYYESGVGKENWKVLFDSNEFIWFSEKSDWGHLYLYDLATGQLKNQITKGDWAVQQLLHIDETTRECFFTAGGKEDGNPYHKYLYKTNFNGNNLTNLSPDKGAHSISFSESFTYFLDTYSTTKNPPVSAIRDRNGNKVMDIETTDISELKAKNWQQPIEFKVKARDNKTDLYGILHLPSHYNENEKYPVINYIYPGPQSGSIRNYGFNVISRDFQAVAELGFVVVAVNAMGTPGRSKSFHDFYYGNMGDNGIPDNITTIKQLATQYKGIDIERVGIWGHSGGGFASTRAIFAYPDFYNVAVSGAGNHDNRNYEADWGEKWQGLLQVGNLEGKNDGTTSYDNQANQLIAKNLKGKLLITHGSMDDNVPPSNTMLVVDALIKANKDFDMILFPNQRHSYGDMKNYMTRKRWDYWVKHLLNVNPPKEFDLNNF